MMEAALSQVTARGSSRQREIAVILGAIALVVALQLDLAFVKSINWDEYFHFSQIHAFRQGEPVGLLQSPFIPLFSWVPDLPGQTIEHIQIIRTFILPFELLAIGCIVACAQSFTDRSTALLCGLVFASAGYAFTQGLALRADMIASAMLMLALAIGFRARLTVGALAAVGVFALLGFVATIKSLLFLPAFLALAYHRRKEFMIQPERLLLGGGAVVLMLLALAWFTPDLIAAITAKLTASFDRMFGGGAFPQGPYLLRQFMLGPIFGLLVVGLALWLWRAPASRDHKIVIALLAAPMLWPVIYLNAYPYFFAFILPPMVVALAPVIALARKRYGTVALVALLGFNAAALWFAEPREPLQNQAQLQDVVRKAFPTPVRYIDESGMLGEYPRAVRHFASGWALANYRQGEKASYRERMLDEPVPLLLANSFALQNVFRDDPAGDRLLREDEAIIRDNFIAHGGLVFVAGKRLRASEQRANAMFATPGRYRVEGGAIEVDGVRYEDGQQLDFERRSYALKNLTKSEARLRWASAGRPVLSDITLQNLFSDY